MDKKNDGTKYGLKKKCSFCNKKALYLFSLEWTYYSLENGDIDGTGDVMDVEKEEFYCKEHDRMRIENGF